VVDGLGLGLLRRWRCLPGLFRERILFTLVYSWPVGLRGLVWFGRAGQSGAAEVEGVGDEAIRGGSALVTV